MGIAEFDMTWLDDPQWIWDDYGWWCLAHNFDNAATLVAMADVSWQRGFDTGRTLAGFCEQQQRGLTEAVVRATRPEIAGP